MITGEVPVIGYQSLQSYYQPSIIILFIMKKLGLLLIACFAFAAFASAQNNIVKSLERNVPGQGKVTIHQDARIEALIGQEAE